ncbi:MULTISPECIES: hypothetical protein [Planktothrix]|uniref:hypothetical protein n=1 Tax=Planktothrix TaxID=54304 RepID=UPI00192CB207|nr:MULTISPECIES: hypothetical protein [Planktothrix]
MTLSNKPPYNTLKPKATSTVGRGKVVKLDASPSFSKWNDEFVTLFLGDSLEYYAQWEQPTVIVSDGAYGVLGFEGYTSDHLDLPQWYEPHIQAWSKAAMPCKYVVINKVNNRKRKSIFSTQIGIDKAFLEVLKSRTAGDPMNESIACIEKPVILLLVLILNGTIEPYINSLINPFIDFSFLSFPFNYSLGFMNNCPQLFNHILTRCLPELALMGF